MTERDWLRPDKRIPKHPVIDALLLLSIFLLIALAAGIQPPPT